MYGDTQPMTRAERSHFDFPVHQSEVNEALECNDRSALSEYADEIRMKERDLAAYQDDERVVVISLKRKMLESIKLNVSSVSNLGVTAIEYGKRDAPMAKEFFKRVGTWDDSVAKFIMKHIGPSYAITSEGEEVDPVLLLPRADGTKPITDTLTAFGVPQTVATNANGIWTNGITRTGVSSLVLEAFNAYMNYDDKPVAKDFRAKDTDDILV